MWLLQPNFAEHVAEVSGDVTAERAAAEHTEYHSLLKKAVVAGTWKSFKNHHVNMDTLIAPGTGST